jgi:hypothetical protein
MRLAIGAAVFLTIWGLITHGTFAGSGDEPHYLMTAQSIAFDGDLDLANNYAAADSLIAGGTLTPDGHALPGTGGILRPAHDVGLPLVFAPYVRLVYPLAEWLGGAVPAPLLERARLDASLILRHLISLAMGALAAVLALQLFAIFARGTPSRGVAAAWALLVVLSPPLLSHSFLFFTEIPSALLIVWSFRVLSEPGASRPPWLAVGAATGLLLLVHVRNIAVVLGLIVWAIARLRRSRAPRAAWAGWMSGLAVLLLMRTAVVYTFWGSLLTTPLASAGTLEMPAAAVVREALVRASGLLLDQEFGLLPYAPLYLLLPVGVVVARARGVAGAGAALALAAAYVATIVSPHVNVHGWTGGWAPPARMITPIVPLLAIFVFTGAQALSTGAGRALTTGVVVTQVVINAVVWQWPKVLWNAGDGSSALLSGVPAIGSLLPSWHGPGPSAARFVVFAAAWSVVTWWVIRSLPTSEHAVPSRFGKAPVR